MIEILFLLFCLNIFIDIVGFWLVYQAFVVISKRINGCAKSLGARNF